MRYFTFFLPFHVPLRRAQSDAPYQADGLVARNFVRGVLSPSDGARERLSPPVEGKQRCGFWSLGDGNTGAFSPAIDLDVQSRIFRDDATESGSALSGLDRDMVEHVLTEPEIDPQAHAAWTFAAFVINKGVASSSNGSVITGAPAAFGRFYLQELVNSGGMADIWLATDSNSKPVRAAPDPR